MKSALGIHIGNDRGAALVIDGQLVAQMAEERLDRRKHSNSPELPDKSIAAVLEIAGIGRKQLGTIGISYTNVVIDEIVDQLTPEVRELLKLPSIPVHGIGHHDCHAWSTYCTSDFDRALVLVADGAGDIIDNRLEAESLYLGERDSLTLLDRRLQDFGLARATRRNSFNLSYMSAIDRTKQISLGRKYEQFTYLIGFEHGQAGKLMALASYADPLYLAQVPAFTDLQFPLRFDDGLDAIDEVWRRSGKPWHRFVKENAKGIAAAGQALLEAYMIRLLSIAAFQQRGTALCAAGGLFLNCQLNSRILAGTKFDKLHVIPAAGDDGQCVGAAFAAYAKDFRSPRRTSTHLPYLGRRHSHSEIEDRLRYFDMKSEVLSDTQLIRRLSGDLANGRVVGFLRGRSEIGPRALCHRSLLADPRREEMKDYLNLLKRRELFRPFAPVVTADAQRKFFDLQQDSPYMLLAAMVRPEYRTSLPAITHIDGTARVQGVEKDKESFVYELLKAFEKRTGFPILLNTSFNVAGDPIVETPHDAIVTFLNTKIDVLVLENHYIDKAAAVKTPA